MQPLGTWRVGDSDRKTEFCILFHFNLWPHVASSYSIGPSSSKQPRINVSLPGDSSSNTYDSSLLTCLPSSSVPIQLTMLGFSNHCSHGMFCSPTFLLDTFQLTYSAEVHDGFKKLWNALNLHVNLLCIHVYIWWDSVYGCLQVLKEIPDPHMGGVGEEGKIKENRTQWVLKSALKHHINYSEAEMKADLRTP